MFSLPIAAKVDRFTAWTSAPYKVALFCLILFLASRAPETRAQPSLDDFDGPTPTPNGKIVFSRYPFPIVSPTPTPGGDGDEIYSMDPDGTNVLALTSGGASEHPSKTQPNWSPNGTKIAYVWTPFVVAPPYSYVNVKFASVGGDGERLIDGYEPAWSPDGTKIAFGRGGYIWIMNADGWNPIKLNLAAQHPCWSPDQTKIAFFSSGSIHVANANGSNSVALTGTASNADPAWSNDGTRIAYSSFQDGNREIYVMTSNGTNHTRLTNNPAVDQWPTWSPDSTQIAFESWRDGNYPQIYVMNADGSNQMRISNNAFRDRSPNWLRVNVVQPTPTPAVTPVPNWLTLVDRLSDAQAFAHAQDESAPLPQTQTDFLPAHLSNSATAKAAKGGTGAWASSESHSTITVDDPGRTMQVTGSGQATAGAIVAASHAHSSAKLIVLRFTLSHSSYVYSVSGSFRGGDSTCCSAAATVKLTSTTSTIFEVPPAISFSQAGTLFPGTYTLSVYLSVSADPIGFPPNEVTNSADFSFAIGPTPTPGVTQAVNLSTRLLVGTEDNVGISGFIITGSAPKQVLLRGIGPSLANFGVPDALADPILELHGPPGFVTIISDDWRNGNCNVGPIGTCTICPTNDLESMICATLDPGAYTAIISGKNNGAGVGLVEVYDLGQAAASKLANISTRAFVSTGSDIVIAGFVLVGNTGNDNVILRGIGPSLSTFGVPDALADPTLELRDGSGTLIQANNNWMDDPTGTCAAIIVGAGLAPTNALEAAICATLVPGQYTALLSGVNNGTGVGLVEMYDLLANGPFPTPTPGGTATPTPTPTP